MGTAVVDFGFVAGDHDAPLSQNQLDRTTFRGNQHTAKVGSAIRSYAMAHSIPTLTRSCPEHTVNNWECLGAAPPMKQYPFDAKRFSTRWLLMELRRSEEPFAQLVSAAPELSRQSSTDAGQAVVECRDNLDFMSRLPAGTMKLIVTSPPYNIGKKYEQRASLDAYLDQQCRVIDQCMRLLHPNGSLCWQIGNHVDNGEIFPLDILLYDLFKKRALKLRNRIIWHFEHGLHCSKRLSGRYETILWFTKSEAYTFNLDPIRIPSKYPSKKHFKGPKAGQLSGNPLGKNPSDVWVFPNVKNNHVEKTIHPCQFPVELVERLVLSMTNAGENVLDPYMGVGSSVIAAIKHSRNGYGCDTVQQYVDIASERLRQLKAGTLRTRPMNRPVYDPTLPHGGHR